jgi:hypothetical protein
MTFIPGCHYPQPLEETLTHRPASLEPVPLGEGPPSQDDTGQGHRLPLQDPDNGGTTGDLWGDYGERRQGQPQ